MRGALVETAIMRSCGVKPAERTLHHLAATTCQSFLGGETMDHFAAKEVAAGKNGSHFDWSPIMQGVPLQ